MSLDNRQIAQVPQVISRFVLAATAPVKKVIGRGGFHTLAILIATTTVPALAADKVIASHEVRFDHISFVCGEKNESGNVVRFIHSTPTLKYLPENELPPSDPLARSWDIAYRIICEGDYQLAEPIAKDEQRSVR